MDQGDKEKKKSHVPAKEGEDDADLDEWGENHVIGCRQKDTDSDQTGRTWVQRQKEANSTRFLDAVPKSEYLNHVLTSLEFDALSPSLQVNQQDKPYSDSGFPQN